MPDAAAILERVRSYGANLIVDATGLRIIGREKLPAAAIAFIADYREPLIDLLGRDAPAGPSDDVGKTDPINFGAGTPPEWLALFADILERQRPAGILDADWQWFLTRCRQIVDEASYLKNAA